MFDGKLKTSIKGGYVVGSIVLPGPKGGILISAKERIHKGDVSAAVSKIVDQISHATEFFPIRDLIGEESFVKAVELYALTKRGTADQKAKAVQEIKTICKNAHDKLDPTSQDIEYAMMRLARAEKANQIKISGDFVFDAFGFSPANLKKNLDKLAQTNPMIAKAKELFQALNSGDKNRVNEAKRYIRRLYVKLNSANMSVSGITPEQVIVLGISQYARAKKFSEIKTQVLGRDDVTVGVSLKSFKKAAKKAGGAIKSTAKAAAITATAPVSLPVMMIKKGPKAGAKSFLKATAVTALGPAAVPILATKKGREALTDVKNARKVPPATAAKVAALAAKAEAGDPQAKNLIKKMGPAGKAVAKIALIQKASEKGNPLAKKALTGLKLAIKTDNNIQQLKKAATSGSPKAMMAVKNLAQAEVPEEYLDEELNDAVVEPDSVTTPGDEQYEEVYEEIEQDIPSDYPVTETAEDIEEYEEEEIEEEVEEESAEEEIVGKFSLKPGKKFKKAMGTIGPIAKAMTPLIAKVADSYAPGSGAAISTALPAIIDAIPADKRPGMDAIAKSVDIVKAASEMDPEAMMKIETIKKLAEQGVPDAEKALNGLKLAKALEKTGEAVMLTKGGDIPQAAQAAVNAVKAISPATGKAVAQDMINKASTDGVVNVRIVEWGPK